MPTRPHAQSVTELLELRRVENANQPFVHTGAAEFGDELKTLTFGEFAGAVDRLAAHYARQGLQPAVAPGDIPPERVVGVLVASSIEETILEMALIKLGLTPLLISVNNSPAAVAHLCKKTRAHHLIYGTKFAATARTAAEAIAKEQPGVLGKMMGDETAPALKIVPEMRYPLWGPGGVADELRQGIIAPFRAVLTPAVEAERGCVILHSSGSTGFPKPVSLSHRAVVANSAVQEDVASTFMNLPLFHALGHFVLLAILYHGTTITCFPPHIPATVATLTRVIHETPTPPHRIIALPFTLGMFAETDWGIEELTKVNSVQFGGSALSDDLGNRLVAAGVNLVSIYGATETGYLFTSMRDFANDKGWNWLRPRGAIRDYMELVPDGTNMYELVIKAGWSGLVMSNRDDGGYSTSDLFQQHPNYPEAFKYLGRLDDTIVHSLGEKTNPVPIENNISGDSPLIADCIVFGDGRPQTGALLVPTEKGAKLSQDRKAYIDVVWPVVADANSNAPSHSRITPEMIVVLPYGTTVPKTAKLSLLRPAAYRQFADSINSAYNVVEEKNAAPKRKLKTQREMEAFLTETVERVLSNKHTEELTPMTDLFGFGVDSIASTRVRNDIMKTIDLNGAVLGQNVVYEHPTIANLAAYLIELEEAPSGGADHIPSAATSAKATLKLMTDMVDKWASKVIMPKAAGPLTGGDRGHHVLLTGATGSLGAHILDQLARHPSVAKVICLSRASTHAASRERVHESLLKRKRRVADGKFESYAADVSKPYLGLTPGEYAKIRDAVTAVVHNAWPVNFNMALSSFEEHVCGTVNLINMAMESKRPIKPSFFFSSSISTWMGRPDMLVPEDFAPSPEMAAGYGYAQSKWVVEKLLERVGDRVRAGVFRIGQMTGDTENGVWNETESWPLLFHAANEIGELPRLDYHPAWIPFDVAGRAVSEVVAATNTLPQLEVPHAIVYHIINTKQTSWDTILDGLKRGGLRFEEADRFEWLNRLEHSNPDPSVNPTYKLLWFYKNRFGGQSVPDDPAVAIERTSRVSQAIANCRPIDEELVTKWAKNWMQNGFVH